MADAGLRLALVVAVIVIAAVVAIVARRRGSYHHALDIEGAGFDPGLVIFTSTDCRRCKEVLEVAKATGAPLREVTYELEAGLQERLGVTGVPLTLVVDSTGKAAAQFAGSIHPRRLGRALARSGI